MTGHSRPDGVQGATERVPLSYGQRALWYLHQLAAGASDRNVAALNAAQVVRVPAAVDLDALAAAVDMLTGQHPILRATYHLDERGEPYQRINASVPRDHTVTDARGWSEAELDAAVARETKRPFNLETGPVMRLSVFRRGEEDYLGVFAFHHIAIDLWSIGLLTYELGACYRAALTGEPPALRPEARDYAAFARDQIACAEGEKGAVDWAYWSEKLRGPLPPLDLPLDRPRPAVQTYDGAAEVLRLDAELTAAIKELAESRGASLYDACLAAYQALLGRYTRQDDILVGALKAGRSVRYAFTVGYFVNQVVMRADLRADPSFADFLAATHEQVVEGNAHEAYPFPLLVEKLPLSRDPARPPVFQALFSWQKTTRLLDRKQAASFILSEAGSKSEWAGLPMELAPQRERATHFELTLLVAEAGNELVATVEYNTALFDADTARRFLRHFATLLRSATASPHLPLSRLSILPDDEAAALLSLWAHEQASYAPGLIHTAFEAQAARRPDAIALEFEGEDGAGGVVSYGELNRRADALAARLTGLGVGPEDLVGLVADRGPAMIVAILGILKAGAAYLPLDPAYPPERLAYMLDDSRAAALLVTARARETGAALLAATDGATELGEEDGLALWQLVASHSANGEATEDTEALEEPLRALRQKRRPPVSPENLAYVIYTSGSTGRPKGVGVTHANVTRLFAATDAWFGFSDADAWSLFHSYAFDFSVWEIWGALLYGGRLCITPYLTSRAPEEFIAFLRRHRITILNQTPSAFRQLVAAEERVGVADDLALRLVIFGGEALNLGDLRAWFARHGDARPQLVNMYGITETTVHVTYRPLRAADLDTAPGSAVGRPIPDLRLLCLDPRGAPVPFGVPGELYVGGAGVARGYLGRPDLTAERFAPEGWNGTQMTQMGWIDGIQIEKDHANLSRSASSAFHSNRLYRTGDLARILPTGDVIYLGRADQQVKIRGFRIEPGEVAAALKGVDGVSEVVVIPHAVDGDTRLAAYVVPAQGADEDALRAALLARGRRALPDYMVPAAVVFLPALPLTAQGKLDRAALPAPEWSGHAGRGERVALDGELERQIAAVWRDALRVPEIGAEDNFFALGGHSLLATQALAQLRDRLGLAVSLRDLFEAPTVRELARRVQVDVRPDRSSPSRSDAPVRSVSSDNAPLSYAQQRLWFIEQLDPGTPLYNIPVALRLRGPLDADALRRGLNAAVARHSALRATFRAERGVPRQVIAPALTLELPVEEVGADYARRVEEAARRPFDLERGPLLRAALLCIATDDHILALTAHHLVADGWSLGVLARELMAALAGETLPPLPLEYADVAAWQRAWLEGEGDGQGEARGEDSVRFANASPLQAQLDYWKGQLAEVTPRLDLPTDRPRPAVTTHNGALLPFALDAETAAALRKLAREQNVTLYMVLLAAFQTLLARYSGQSDIPVGTAVAGRERAEWQGLAGLFVNTLVMRGDLSGNPTFGELLARTRHSALDAFSHADVPFDLLIDALGVERSLGSHPLFAVMLSLQDDPADALALGGAQVEWLPADTGTAKYDFLINLFEGRGGLRGILEYNTDLYDASTMRRFLCHFATLLSNLPGRADERVARLPILPAEERRQILEDWNDTTTGYPRERTLAELFDRQADETPGALAVAYGEDRLLYRELDAAANRLAARLARDGAGPDRLVAVLMDRSADMVVALLAIIKAGAAYLPLDPANPPERIALMLRDAAAPLVLTEQKHARLLALAAAEGDAANVITLDADGRSGPGGWALTAGESDARPRSAAHPDNLAYVIYTSGSTGAPKGIAIPQRAVTRLVRNTDYIGLTPADRIAQASNASFDAATFEIWGALLSGAALIGAPRDTLLDPAEFAAFLRRERINTLFLTTALFNQMAAGAPDAFATLKHLMFGGEACDPGAVAAVLQAGPPERLLHVYGPTESTTYASWRLVTSVPPGARAIPIGRPIANTRIYVLDAELQPVPPGVIGELYVAGDGLARSYLRRPDLTAERFLPDPFIENHRLKIENHDQSANVQSSIFNLQSAATFGCRMYRTGDLVRYLPDGSIEFVGRADGQIKLRGFRVELGEIETALRGHPAIRQAAVLLTGEGAARRLVACVTCEGAAPPAFELAARLRQTLPDYMTPSAFVALPAFPLGPTGKVDRAALERLARDASSAAPTAAPRAWRTPAEELIAMIWEDVLGHNAFGPDDSFFAVGGHSLLAVQVVARIEETFGAALPVADVFELPTVAGLAARVEGGRPDRSSPSRSDAPVRSDSNDNAPLSYAQQRLWFLQQLDPDSPSYNVSLALRLTGALDAEAFARALARVVARHSALRTRFAWDGSSPRQVIESELRIPAREIDLRGAADPEAEAETFAQAEAAAPFDLAAGPLLRAVLLRTADETHLAVFTAHHIVCDGWSLGVFSREFAAFYAEAAGGPAANLPALPIQYADFAEWQQRWLVGDALDALLAYWREQFTPPPPPLDLPADRPHPAVQTGRGGHIDFTLPRELVQRLASLARSEAATLFMALLAGYETLLHRLTGQDDFAVGAPVAGRSRREVEDLIGVFINPLALRADFSRVDGRAPTFSETLRRVRGTALAAFAHADAPFERIIDALQLPRELNRAPLFQALFALQTSAEAAPLKPLALPGVAAEVREVDTGATKYDLSLTAIERDGALACRLGYNADLFDADTATRIAARYAALLAAAVENPAETVDRLTLLPTEEAALIASWSDGPALPVDPRPFPTRFAAQVAAAPDAVAVEAWRGATDAGAERLTYAELDATAGEVARALRDAGVCAGEIVGVLAATGPAALIAALGAWAAGAAYLPLDPALPASRLRYMLDDARARCVLADLRCAELLREITPESASIAPLDAAGRLLFAADESRERAPQPETDAALAYVIYTSGSTGAPKGVAVDHGSVGAYLDWVNGLLMPQPAPALPALTRLSFDASLKQLFAPLLRGDAVWFLPQAVASDPAALLAALSARPNVALNCVPSLWHTLLNAAELGVAPRPAGLARLFLGGEAIPAELLARTRALLPEVDVWNLYGPTETTANACAGPIRPGERVTIGRPIANTQALILDAHGQPAAIGVPGELLIGGAGVTRGYLGQPELTADRFWNGTQMTQMGWIDRMALEKDHADLSPSASAASHSRLYRTGDRCRWLPDGRIEYLGRMDDQVKVRGFRVELGEVEAALAGHPQVAEAAVAVSDSPSGSRLVAVVAARPGAPAPDAAALLQHAAARLPDYMVPGQLAIVPALPRLPNGKVDRQAVARLAAAGAEAQAEDADATPPDGPIEQIVAGIWQELLGLPVVSRASDFFRAGGHSLLAAQAVSRIRAAFGVDLPLTELFRRPTVAGLAAEIRARLDGGAAQPLPPIAARGLDGPLPPSFGQERLWFLDQLEPGAFAYNVPVAVRLTGALDADALSDSLNDVIRRHAVLRATFEARDGAPALRIARELVLPLPAEQLTGDLLDAIRAEARQPFDLATGPLLRARLWRLDPETHVLMLTAHHAVSDGWSLGVLVDELAQGYANRLRKGAAGGETTGGETPPLRIQYTDYAAWQREWLAGDAGASALAGQLAYWREQLADLPPRLELPLDRPRPPVKGSRGATVAVEWPAELAQAAGELARAEGATLFMTLLAAFQALLGRVTGQDDIPVGTAVAGRSRPEVERLIGFFVNTVIVRGDLAPHDSEDAPTFRRFLARVRETSLAAFVHADAPFEAVVDAVSPERDTSRSPLFQVMFLLQNAGLALPELPGLRVEPVDFDPGIENFDLTLAARQTADGLSLAVSYDTALFDEATIRRLLAGYRVLVEAALAAPDTPVWALPVLPRDEWLQEVAGWNATETPFPADKCLHGLFEAQAALTPDALALRHEGAGLTYAQLNAQANILARQLRAAGVGPEAVVALVARRSLEAVVGMLAALKAGGAWTPVDPTLPPARIAAILSDCRPVVALVQPDLLADAVSAPSEALRRVDHITALPLTPVFATEVTEDSEGSLSPLSPLWQKSEAALWQKREAANLPNVATPRNLAYIIYTSGSTGAPRGVCVEHRSVVNHNVECSRRLALTAADRYLQFASLSFDTAIEEIFPALISGATVVLHPNRPIAAGHEFRRLIEAEGITVADPPTAFWHEWAYEVSRGERLPESVRLVFVGGEKIAPDRLALWRANTPPHTRWLNGYGPTEGTIIATIWEAPPGPVDPQRHVPIGKPIANTRVYLLDERLQPVPPGSAGEIYIAGECVSRGYFGQPDMTAERFLPDPFIEDLRFKIEDKKSPARQNLQSSIFNPQSRMFRTGDRGRRLPNGDIEYLGRADHQVKVRGFRVELEEIEKALALHPGARDAAVIHADGRLVAFVVPQEGAGRVPPLRDHLAATLPAYMVPQRFVALDALPVTRIGKVDRRALAALAADGAGSDATPAPDVFEPPATPVEALIAQIWGELLAAEPVDRRANFFELGGHSLLATRAISRVRDVFGVDLPLLALFDAPTPAGLAAAVEAALAAGDAPSLPPVTPRPDRDPAREEIAPLSFGQERLWFLERLSEGAAGLNLPVALRITGPLDLPALAASLDEVVARHGALRTTFRDGVPPAQVIAPAATFRLFLPVEASTAPIEAIVAEEAARPFDLARGPLIRGRILRVSADEHVLLLTLHHAIADGWSLALLTRELTEAYAARATGADAPTNHAPALQYADFAAWQAATLAAPGPDGRSALDAQLAYWQRQLAGLPPLLDLPADRPRPTARAMRSATLPFALATDLTARLRGLARGEGVTLRMVVLAAYQLLLARYSGQSDIAVGEAVAGRGRAELEPVVGFFVNSLVLRGDLRGNPSFRELLARTRRVALEAFAHADAPFEKVVDALTRLSTAPQRDLSRPPLFQAALAWENAGSGPNFAPLTAAGLRIEPLPAETGIATYDLFLSLAEEGDGLTGFLKYSADLFDRPRMERLLGHLTALLEAAVADPAQGIRDLPMLTAAELGELREWSRGTETDLDQLRPVHEIIAENARRAPDALAAQFGAQTLTYAEMDARSRAIAALLRSHGTGRGSLVALYLERSADMLAAILGAWRAGAAYVPLDPTYPAERVATMLADSGAAIVLTHSWLAGELPVAPGVQTILSLDEMATAARPEGAPPAGATLDDVAYVIYTSGSTGAPKGATLTHRGLSNLAAAQAGAFGLGAGDRVLQFSRLSFDASVWEIVMALTAGATLCLAEQDTLAAPNALAALLVDRGITAATLPPVMLAALPAGEYPALRTLIAAGERCPMEVAAKWLAEGRAVWNAYGPTETTVCATWHRVTADDAADAAGSAPIGRPLPNLTAHALDAYLQPVPVGVTGELYVGGPALALGYLGRPDLTAERFVPNRLIENFKLKIEEPLGPAVLQSSIFNHASRLYRTGDRVRRRADGSLVFLDRADEQVKVRGFRVEPGEIEARLRAHAQVAEAAVVAVPAPSGATALVAYVAPRDAGDFSADALTAYLGAALPDYMVPAAICPVDALPLTPSGKIDRRALTARGWPQLSAAGEDADRPLTPAEATLAAIWAAALRVPSVGPRDNFFALGGDSILAMEVTTRAREAGLNFPVRRIFETRTLAELAAATPVNSVAPAAAPAQPTEPFPLTPIQQWFLALNLPEPDHWNQSVLLEVSPLDAESLRRGLATVVARHDALRLRLERDARGAWMQRALPATPGPLLTVVDLTAVAPDARQAVMEATGDALQRDMSLAEGRLFAAAYFHAGPEQPARLYLVAHHWAIDAVSWRVLLKDLRNAYLQEVATDVVQLPAGTTTFGDWAAHLAAFARSPQVLAELAYWQAAAGRPAAPPAPLTQSEGLSMLTARAHVEADAETLRVRLPAAQTRGLLRDVGPVFGADAGEALVAGLARAWQCVTGERELLVALEGHGRREELFDGVDLTQTVGWFTALYPQRIRLDAADDAPEASLAAVKEQLRSVPRGGLGYGLLRYGLAGDEAAAALAALPAPLMSFNYLGQIGSETAGGVAFRALDGRLGPSRSPRGMRPFPLEVSAQAQDGELVIEWTCAADAAIREPVGSLAAAHLAALEEIVAACSAGAAAHYTPSDFPDVGFSQSEVDALVDELEASRGNGPAEATWDGTG